MKYFHYSQGLRGCYMPDSSRVLACRTRRELKDALKFDVDSYHDAGFVGGSQRAVAQFAAECWRNAPSGLPLCLPFANRPRVSESPNYTHGIFISAATRAEYLAYEKEQEQ
jgi:hypothetical protein